MLLLLEVQILGSDDFGAESDKLINSRYDH